MKTEYKSLEHGSTVVTVNNKREYDFINSWAEEKEKLTLSLEGVGYPIFIATAGDGLMWTDLTDRGLYYMSFDEFLVKIGYKLTPIIQ